MHVPGYATSPNVVTLRPERLGDPLRWGTPRRVFVNSMSDLFHRDVPFTFITSAFEVMAEASESRGHVFQVLTKRPGRAVAWWNENISRFDSRWPAGIWIGTSVESQKYVPRVDVLARLPAAVRFVSAEPLIDPVDFGDRLQRGLANWIIVGGESGHSARPMPVAWAETIVQQCRDAGVAVFVKQLGTDWAKRNTGERNKASDMSNWPEGLKIRQYPHSGNN